MTLVIVTHPGRLTGAHREHGLAAVQRLDLAFLVHAQHNRPVGRGHVKANDVTHFGDEIRIGGELEGLDPMRLQAEGAPDPLHGLKPTGRLPWPCRANSNGWRCLACSQAS